MNFPSRFLAAMVHRGPGIFGAMIAALGPGLLVAQPGVAVESRVQRIANALLPPALVHGEALSTTALADRRGGRTGSIR